MAREVPELDRLIEEGLTLYGQGDLDGALARWSRALQIDPENAQASSYVDYVRANYALLTSDLNGEATAEGAPFGIADDEPEYQIEIQPGEVRAVSAQQPVTFDPSDEGWFIGQEPNEDSPTVAFRAGNSAIAVDKSPSQDLTLEMEADEPPDSPLATKPMPQLSDPSFDDTTREYPPRAMSDPYGTFAPQPTPPPPAAGTSEDFSAELTPGFGQPHDFQTPPGFGSAATGIKKRGDLGFVKPASATDLGLPQPRKPATPPLDINVTPESLDLSLEPADIPTTQRKPISSPPPLEADEAEELDLIGSLPSPKPAAKVPQIAIDTPLSGSTIKHPTHPQSPPASTTSTRDFPPQMRAPATPASQTREMLPDERPVVASKDTQDFDVKTKERLPSGTIPPVEQTRETREIPSRAQVAIVSAPTRDLGLREVAEAMSHAKREIETRADVVLPFDPIDARTAEILDEVDCTAPPSEAKEDQTRRRITTLFEKAAEWSAAGDLERAVAAVDLALSEEPSSALAQKLIHRNRETIMNVFQAYLGDLERTPQLAKPLHELANAPISPRAAFLLSRIDGLLSIDEILDVCGMPRLEAFRYLCQLYLRGILR